MALNEIQWGRILALAWLDDEFKAAFEKDPARALRGLKTRPGLGADLFEELGLDEDASFIDLEHIADYPVDFPGVPKARLLKIKNGDEYDKVKLADALWHWGLGRDAIKGIATREAKGTLTAAEWGRIYARIWEDERFGDPKKNYKARFERDPAEVVNDITAELSISHYKYQYTRLFVIGEKPNWDDEQLEGMVTTGTVNGHPLVWMVTKTC